MIRARLALSLAAVFEELNCALMLFGRGASLECTKVLSALSLDIHLARIQPVLAARELSNHPKR
jgi:hypothetical protein